MTPADYTQETPMDMMADWKPPELGRQAANWLVSQLPDALLLKLARLIKDDPETRDTCSGFRLNAVALKNQAVKNQLRNRISSLMLLSRSIRLAFFVFTFPSGRWFKWAEVLDAHDLDWILFNWRDLIRFTGDPALAVAMALDERDEVAKRGERLLVRDFLWEYPAYRPTKEADLPEAWARLMGLAPVSDEGTTGESKGQKEELLARLEFVSNRKIQLERQNAKLRQELEGLDNKVGKLQEQLDKRQKQIRELKKELRAERARVGELSTRIDERVKTELGKFYQDLAATSRYQDLLWKEALEGSERDLVLRVERAISSQKALDVRYGTRTRIREKIRFLEEKLREVENALSDALYPSRHLWRVREELKGQIDKWGEMLTENPAPRSPVAKAILKEGEALCARAKGTSQVEDLVRHLDMPPLKMVVDSRDRSLLRTRLLSLIEDKRQLQQARLLAEHLPERSFPGEPREISSLSAFVIQNPALCLESVLLIDGYNAIKTSSEWAEEERKDFTQARNRFCEFWETKARDWSRVELVFDGQEDMTRIDEIGNLLVVYTDARADSQKADLYIQERMRELKKKDPDRRLFLITADRALRDAVSKWCDFFIEPRWALIQYLSLEG